MFPIRRSRCRIGGVRRSRSATILPLTWPQWLVDDQREESGRTDVLTYTSAKC